jgi:hypothetical protein
MASHSSLALIFLAAAPCAVLGAQQRDSTTFHLDVASIMRGEETVGRAPGGVQWSADSKWIYFQWAAPGTDWRVAASPYRVRAEAGARPEKITRAQLDSMTALTVTGPADARWQVARADNPERPVGA